MTSGPNPGGGLPQTLTATIESLIKQFPTISDERKAILDQLAWFVETKLRSNQKAELIFICTHNSRRSHLSQIWAQAAASYYCVPNVVSYSGGTEATAFNPRAVKAMEKLGFEIEQTSNEKNPIYKVYFSDNEASIIAFSKRYDSQSNPTKGFAAVMTCSHADENCPVVVGMEKRISLPYNDPKDYDGTSQEEEKYMERAKEIGKELLYAFSQVKVEQS